MNAFGYLRVSKYDVDTTSPQRQRAAIEQLCKANRWTLVETFEDIDRSGYNGVHRPGLERMLGRLGEAQAVVAYRLDRLTRSTPDFYRLQQRFKDAGVRFQATDITVDPSTPEGKFTETLLAALAQMESDRISVRSRAMFEYKKERGEALGRPPYGWRRVGKHWEQDPAQQAVLRDAARRYVDGESFSEIAVSHGLLIGPLSKMLRSERVQQALPSDLAGELAVALMARKGQRVPHPQQTLLGGIATCATCADPLRAEARRGDRFNYGCHAGHAHISAQWLEDYVTERVLTAVDSGELLKAIKRRKPLVRTRKASEIEARMALADEEFAAARMTADRYRRLNASLVDQLAEAAKSEREAGFTLPEELARDLRATWPKLTVPERRKVIQAVFKGIVVTKARKQRVRIDERRVKLAWR